MQLPQESSSWPSMTSLYWMGMSLDARVRLSMKSALIIVSPLRSGSGAFLHCFWMRYVPLLKDMLDTGAIHPSQSPCCNAVVLVRKKDGTLLHGFLQAQCVDQKGLIPTAADTGSTGEYGRCCAFFNDGFQEQILASPDGAQVPTVYHLHGGKSWVLPVHLYALWALQCPHDFSMPHAEHLGRVEPNLLCHLFR